MPNMVPVTEKVTVNPMARATDGKDDSRAHQNETPTNLVVFRGFSIIGIEKARVSVPD